MLRTLFSHGAAVLAGGLIGALLVAGAPTPPAPPPAAPASPVPTRSSATSATSTPAAPIAPAAEADDCLCGRDRDVLEALLARARRDAYGEPTPWPADPGPHAPEIVREVLDQAARECGAGARLQTVDCEEPPCIGVFDLGEGGSPPFVASECRPWVDAGLGPPSYALRQLRCGERPVTVWLLTPTLPDELSPGIDPQDQRRRLEHRWDVLAESACP